MTNWRVMTWNIRGAARPDLRRIADVVRDLHPDVVAMQEVRQRQAQRLAADLGWRHEWVFKHNAWTFLLWWRAEGLALLSPTPLAGVWRTCLTPDISRRSYRRRVAIAATVQHDDAALRVYDLHLTTDDEARRRSQASTIAARIVIDRPLDVVVAGDLNAAHDAELLAAFTAGGLVDPGGAMTSPAQAPVQRIDYVLVPSAATVVERHTPDGGGTWAALSDHLPTLVELTI
ncbi:MAG: endonuclease/exonuclease/phosphatase family protein [Ilumatobacteraceae bacterium]